MRHLEGMLKLNMKELLPLVISVTTLHLRVQLDNTKERSMKV